MVNKGQPWVGGKLQRGGVLMLVISAPVRKEQGGSSSSLSNPQLHTEFHTSLGYKTAISTKQRKEKA